MKNKKEDLINKFKLPKYIKNMTFAEASKAIEAKFEGLNDKAAKDTKQALMQRLADMQEYVKQQNAPSEEQYIDPAQMQMSLGGVLNNESIQPGMGAYLQGAGTVLNSANSMFGSTGINTSGKTGNLQSHNTVGATAGATLQGAQAGAQIGGPWGAAIGGAIGLTGGVIGGKRKNDDIKEANQNFDIGQANKMNSFAKGGYQNQLFNGLDDRYINHNTIQNNPEGIVDFESNRFTSPNLNNGANGFGVANNIGAPFAANQEGYFPNANNQKIIDVNNNITKTNNLQSTSTETESITDQKDKKFDIGKFLGENKDALRYTPALMNAFQLANLEKPETEIRQKLDSKYNPTLIDENRIQRDILANQSNTNRAIQNVANGNKGFIAANMQASDLNTSKAIGNASVQAQAQNNAQLQYGQQFDRQADQFNIQQNNLEQDLTDRNKGVYDSNKSALLSQIGNDLGAIGKEELFKKYPTMMGMNYKWNGEYFVNDKGDKKTAEEAAEIEAKSNQSAMGGYQSTFNDHMGMLMNFKKK